METLCEKLNVDFVGIEHLETKKSYVVVKDFEDVAGNRGGYIKYTRYRSLKRLLAGERGQNRTIEYNDFMNRFVRNGNYICSRELLDV